MQNWTERKVSEQELTKEVVPVLRALEMAYEQERIREYVESYEEGKKVWVK